MKEKLLEMSLELNRLRSLEREARLKGDADTSGAMRSEALALEDEMRLLIEKAENETARRILVLKYIDGLPPFRIRYVLGLSRGRYYRLMERV